MSNEICEKWNDKQIKDRYSSLDYESSNIISGFRFFIKRFKYGISEQTMHPQINDVIVVCKMPHKKGKRKRVEEEAYEASEEEAEKDEAEI